MSEPVLTAEKIVTGMLELFSEPEAWTKGEYARDANGGAVMITSENAVCWCLVGGMSLVEFDLISSDDGRLRFTDDELTELGRLIEALTDVVDDHVEPDPLNNSLSVFNDSDNTTHDDILAVLREVDERLKAGA